MKKLLLANLLFVLVMASSTTVFAQKIKILSGNFDFLKDQKELNIEFNYDNLKFYNENISEDEYVRRRMEEISSNKGNEEGKVWKKDWESSKKEFFVNKFLTTFNRDSKLHAGTNLKAKYTLIVETTWIYPGWFAAVMAQKAKVSTTLKFVETANRSKTLLAISSDKAPGDIAFVGVANNNDRMAEGYAKTGKTLSKLINKKI